MRVYRFLNKYYALKSIAERRIKISTIDELNDPFEALSFQLIDRRARESFEKSRQRFSEAYGLLCFSKVWSRALIWSHYADRHRGICLGFDICEDDVIHVTYNASRTAQPKFLSKLRNTDQIIRKCLETKYASWNYEQEIRIIKSLTDREPDGGIFFANFSQKLKLTEVIIGPRLQNTREEIQKEIEDFPYQVEIINSRLAFKSFWVVRQKNQALWN